MIESILLFKQVSIRNLLKLCLILLLRPVGLPLVILLEFIFGSF